MTPTLLITLWAVAVYCLMGPGIEHQFTRIMVMRLVFVFQVVFVCYFGYISLRKFDKMIENYYSNIEFYQTKRTRYMMGALLVCSLLSAAANFIGRNYFFGDSNVVCIPAVLFAVILFCIGYVGDRQHFSIEHLEADNKETGQAETLSPLTENVVADNGNAAAATPLNPALTSALEQLMDTEKLYLEYDLRLTSVANRLGVGRTALSSYINQTLQMSFSDFINSYRIRYAIELMRADKHLSMVQIAEKSGFANDITFYRVFRKHMGTTPKKWRQEAKNS